MAMRVMCKDKLQLKLFVEKIINDSGEGVILRKRGSLYEHGRSPDLLKLKTSKSDAEGIVTRVDETGSVEVKIPSGKTFEVAADDVLISTPSMGDIISFSFESNSRRELPVNPKIFRVRDDLSWSDVVSNFQKDRQYLNESSRGFTSQPLGHWTAKNMRLFLENFAKERNLDPLLPETWYHISSSDIRELKGGSAIVSKFRGGYLSTVQTLFPELDLNKDLLWNTPEKRKFFFERYAKDNGFDPLVAENWYSQTRDKIMETKGATEVVSYHHRSVFTALLDLFPSIGLEKHLFIRNHCKEFFLKYARVYKFDPNIPENWYSQPFHKIEAFSGASTILAHFHGHASRALLSLFPHLNLDRSKFSGVWSDKKKRRKFFENYAKQNGFDPLVADNWYSQREKIINTKGARRIITYHKGSVIQALMDLFPNIGLNIKQYRTQYMMGTPAKRREFFENFAKEEGFDPLHADQWYLQSKEKLLSRKGCKKVLVYHGKKITKALLQLFPEVGFNKVKLRKSLLHM